MTKKSALTALFIIFFITLPGCGFKFAGGGSLPGGISAVCVKIFENRTSETGLETVLKTN